MSLQFMRYVNCQDQSAYASAGSRKSKSVLERLMFIVPPVLWWTLEVLVLLVAALARPVAQSRATPAASIATASHGFRVMYAPPRGRGLTSPRVGWCWTD